jgi:hypothetical protein
MTVLVRGLSYCLFLFGSLGVASVAAEQAEPDKRVVPERPTPRARASHPVPSTLEECFVALERELPPETLAKIRESDERVMVGFHHGLGTWIRNNGDVP